MKTDTSIYYDDQAVVSRNAYLNFQIGPRGCGKTYRSLKRAALAFVKRGYMFIYLRRYKNEIKDKAGTIFQPLMDDSDLKDYNFKYDKGKYFIDGKLAGYAIPLSTALFFKSASFPQVRTIIFDEFLIDVGSIRYLPNEPRKLLDFCETVGRLRDNLRVYCLGNALSVANPYFEFFKLNVPTAKSGIQMFKNNTILVEYIQTSAYQDRKRQSLFGKLIQGTDYEEYAIDNKFLLDSTNLIEHRPAGSTCLLLLYVEQAVYGVWQNDDGNLYISNKCNNSCNFVISLTNASHKSGSVYARRGSGWLKMLRQYFDAGQLFFESQIIKNSVIKFLS